MTKAELDAYYRHLDNIVILKDNIFTERAEGRAEGHAEGRVEGRMEGINEGRLEEKRGSCKQYEVFKYSSRCYFASHRFVYRRDKGVVINAFI